MKIRLIGGYTDTDVAGTARFDNVYIELTPSVFIDSTIGNTKLKTTYGDVSSVSSTGEDMTLPGGNYGFYPLVKVTIGSVEAHISKAVTSTDFVCNICLINAGGSFSHARQYYITSSATEHWVFVLYDKTNKKIIAAYSAPDHPAANNGGKIEHPFANYHGKALPAGYEIIVLDNEAIAKLKAKKGYEGDILRALNEGLGVEFDLDMEKEVEWQARDMDGRNTLSVKSETWTCRRLVEKI